MAIYNHKHLFPVLTTLLFMSVFTGCFQSRDESVPKDLVGHWVTDAPRYEDCYIDIIQTTISFLTVSGILNTYFIERVERTAIERQAVLLFHYENRDGDLFSKPIVQIGAGDNARMQFHNQKHLTWRKVTPEDGDV